MIGASDFDRVFVCAVRIARRIRAPTGGDFEAGLCENSNPLLDFGWFRHFFWPQGAGHISQPRHRVATLRELGERNRTQCRLTRACPRRFLFGYQERELWSLVGGLQMRSFAKTPYWHGTQVLCVFW